VAQRAKTPLLAGGAALAGLAGTLALRARGNHRGGAFDGLRKALPGGSGSRGFSLPKPNLSRRGDLKGGARKLSHNVSEAAKQADRIGQRVSKTANLVQQVSETADDAMKKA
jgi:hypothetical protein